jgi:hypothetical protein
LNAANFFQAEMVGVILPVLNVSLKGLGWSYDALGVLAAIGAAVFLMSVPETRAPCKIGSLLLTRWTFLLKGPG